MKWIEAIVKVLQDEGQALHYTDISQKIIENNYREVFGPTPNATVISIISTSLKKYGENSPFVKVGTGEYYLKPQSEVINLPVLSANMETENSEEIADAEKELISKELVKAFGMYWDRNQVLWKSSPDLFGAQHKGSDKVNFKNQIGIYLLHDGREVIYVGQAINQPIAIRLFQHTSDRLGGRWDRFSWFGFLGVNNDGSLIETQDEVKTSISKIADSFEAILVEGLEPRQNRKRGNNFAGVEFNQTKDPEVEKRQMAEVFDRMKNKFENG